MRQRNLAGLLVLCGLLGLTDTADAKRRRLKKRYRHATAVHASSPGTFGLGLILGGPTGLSGKLFLSDALAVDFAAGYYRGFGGDHGGGGHADLLIHPFSLGDLGVFSMPLYFGVGGRVAADRDMGRFDTEDGLDVGVRVPLGVAFEFNRLPLDIFLELALIVEVVEDDEDKVHLDAAGGIRFWF